MLGDLTLASAKDGEIMIKIGEKECRETAIISEEEFEGGF